MKSIEMKGMVRKLSLRPSVILGGMVVLGMLEFVALQRSQRMSRRRSRPGRPTQEAQQA